MNGVCLCLGEQLTHAEVDIACTCSRQASSNSMEHCVWSIVFLFDHPLKLLRNACSGSEGLHPFLTRFHIVVDAVERVGTYSLLDERGREVNDDPEIFIYGIEARLVLLSVHPLGLEAHIPVHTQPGPTVHSGSILQRTETRGTNAWRAGDR